MYTFVFNRLIEMWARGQLDFDTDVIKVLLTTDAYVPDQDAHDYRNDVTNEVTGTGYTAGGNTVAVTVTRDDVNNRVNIVFAATSWPTATITARRAVYYKSRGGASSADEIILVKDFGANVVKVAQTFNLNALTMRIQN
jgi:hypothetical protein